ncbi:sulfatase-like hydrolase/transferase [Actinotalea caeni]|uniref:sulfatase-like hydrolase/transferase n=1 Tax=Actinotalea caeni TaxID=1348467 RepID=UPI0012E12B74|nr:sulfatase-like hydrolase/transferase [Actinotalea caeni]
MPSPGKPNVLLVMTDQHRADLTRATGCPLDTMPTLDATASRGALFRNAYTAAPLCVPARVSMLTGRFPTAHRVRQNSTGEHALYDADLLDVLREQGYGLGFAGKPHIHRPLTDFDVASGPYWHERGPTGEGEAGEQDRAFDAWLHELDHGVATEPTPFPLERQLPYRIVSDAIDVVDRLTADDPDRPFFCWVSFPEPHNPYQVPSPYFELFPEDEVPDRLAGPEARDAKGPMFRWLGELFESKRPGFDDRWRRYRASYLGMLRLLDDQVARLLDHLGDQLADTVVVHVADHGDFVGEYGLQRKGAGMPEVLMRIPMQISGPGVAPGTQVTEPVSIVDLMPTLCELAGAPIPDGVQGRSLAPLLRGEPAPPAEFGSVYAELGYGGVPYRHDEHPELHFSYDGPTLDELNTVTMSGGTRMVRAGRHKLTLDADGRVELYDLESDPAELVDLADDPGLADVRGELLRLLGRWMIRVADDLPRGAYVPKTVPHNWRWADLGTSTTEGST